STFDDFSLEIGFTKAVLGIYYFALLDELLMRKHSM
ncbi:hypothetical protein CCACVL1_25337, partial [Corchorus capsularis]